MKAQALISIVCALGIGFGAFADDLNPPTWRGEASTTWQAWEFDNDTNPVTADDGFNPYGTAVATVFGDFPYTRWKDIDNGHLGVWRFEDWITVDVPNTDNTDPGTYKEIWIQITYSAGYGRDPELFTLPEETTVETIAKTQLDDYYWHGTYVVRIEPNPEFETIYIEPRDCTLYVDELVVDTRCVPEPASLLLLASCGLLIRRR